MYTRKADCLIKRRAMVLISGNSLPRRQAMHIHAKCPKRGIPLLASISSAKIMAKNGTVAWAGHPSVFRFYRRYDEAIASRDSPLSSRSNQLEV